MTAATVWIDDHFIAGVVALDFANTVYRRTPELGADLFNNAEALITWLDRAHLLPATEHPGGVFTDTAVALDEARARRAQFWTVFDAQTHGRAIPEDAFAGLLETARRGLAGITLNADGSMTALAADGVFTILALRAITLLLSPPAQGVRACDRWAGSSSTPPAAAVAAGAA